MTISLAEQFIRHGTEPFNGVEFPRANPDQLDRSIAHVVAVWNLSERFGISLRLPVIEEPDRLTRMVGGFTPQRQSGTETGPGDLTLVGRWRLVGVASMSRGFSLNLLGGVPLPTGDTEPLRQLQNDLVLEDRSLGAEGIQHGNRDKEDSFLH